MAFNRCQLTEQGRQAVNKALNQLEISSTNMLALETELASNGGVKIHRQTLTKMLISTPAGVVQLQKIEALFRWIDQRLKSCNQGDLCLQEGVHYKELSKKELSKLEISSPYRPSHSTRRAKSSGFSISAQQQVADLLWMLNYGQQEAQFEEAINRLKPASAFLIQASDRRIQCWLVKRLARQVPNFTNAKRFPVEIKTFWDLDRLWTELSKGLEIADDRPEVVIEALCNWCQRGTAVIALYEAHKLDRRKAEALLNEFWIPLVKQLSRQTCSPRSRLVLFLAGDELATTPNRQPLFQVENQENVDSPRYPIPLAHLQQFDRNDVAGWFVCDQVYDLLEQRLGVDNCNDLLQTKLLAWRLDPTTVINDICEVFDLDGGIADIESYWKLDRMTG